jgi:hypothetical protein
MREDHCGNLPREMRDQPPYRAGPLDDARAKALTFSPASIQRTTITLNSRLKTRAFLDMRSPIGNCP